MPLTYNPDAPVDPQPDDWSCSVESAQWLLRSIGRNPGDSWIRPQLLDASIVTQEHGLMDASGAALVRWLQREYGDEMGLSFRSYSRVGWDELVGIVSSARPVMVGGRNWNHWSGVRRYENGGLTLANPAPNWQGVGNVLDRSEFDRLGSFSAITVYDRAEIADPPVPPDPPPAPEPPTDTRMARALVRLHEAIEILSEPAP